MKQKLPFVILTIIALAGGAWALRSIGSSGIGGISGYPIVCPHCEHFFTLDEDGLYNHPKGSKGEGFQCTKCEKFGAKIAVQCDTCKRWVIPVTAPDGTTYCPKCPRPADAENKG
jgi:hypothetical protein